MSSSGEVQLSLICGNGLTLDRVCEAGLELDPSAPFEWPVPSPVGDGLLLDDLPELKRWLTEQRDGSGSSDNFALIAELVSGSQYGRAPLEWGDEDEATEAQGKARDRIHQALRHYLAIAYSWFQKQVDQNSIQSWRWHEWLSERRRNVQTVLSLNYDLVVERLLTRNQVVYWYPYSAADWNPLEGTPGFRSPRIGGSSINPHRNAGPIPVSKPHGSCNFESYMRIEWEGFEDDTYPLHGVSWGADAPLRILSRGELLQQREVADLVVPGEWSSFDAEGIEITWVEEAKNEFIVSSRMAEVLIVVGCSYYPPDQPELRNLFQRLPRFEQVIVADPAPPEELCAVLEDEAGPVDTREDWP